MMKAGSSTNHGGVAGVRNNDERRSRQAGAPPPRYVATGRIRSCSAQATVTGHGSGSNGAITSSSPMESRPARGAACLISDHRACLAGCHRLRPVQRGAIRNRRPAAVLTTIFSIGAPSRAIRTLRHPLHRRLSPADQNPAGEMAVTDAARPRRASSGLCIPSEWPTRCGRCKPTRSGTARRRRRNRPATHRHLRSPMTGCVGA